MLLTVVSATPFEIEPLRRFLKSTFAEKENSVFKKNDLVVQVLITGAGIPLTALNLGSYFSHFKPALAVNAGIAGAFNSDLKIGDVVNVVTERFADLGVEQADGTFTDIHELGLIGADETPFKNGMLINPKASEYHFLPVANGLTVNKVHGKKSSITAIKSKYYSDVESMEGAAFFLAALKVNVDFLQIRAVSNFVEPRNKDNWNIPLAIENLNQVLIEMVKVYL